MKEVLKGISNAIVAGDLDLALRIVWAKVEVEWFRWKLARLNKKRDGV